MSPSILRQHSRSGHRTSTGPFKSAWERNRKRPVPASKCQNPESRAETIRGADQQSSPRFGQIRDTCVSRNRTGSSSKTYRPGVPIKAIYPELDAHTPWEHSFISVLPSQRLHFLALQPWRCEGDGKHGLWPSTFWSALCPLLGSRDSLQGWGILGHHSLTWEPARGQSARTILEILKRTLYSHSLSLLHPLSKGAKA